MFIAVHIIQKQYIKDEFYGLYERKGKYHQSNDTPTTKSLPFIALS